MKKLILFSIIIFYGSKSFAVVPNFSDVPTTLVCGSPYYFTLISSGNVPGYWTKTYYIDQTPVTQTINSNCYYSFHVDPAYVEIGEQDTYILSISVYGIAPTFDESTFPNILCFGSSVVPVLPSPNNGITGYWEPSIIDPNYSKLYRFYPDQQFGCYTPYISRYISIGNMTQFSDFQFYTYQDVNGIAYGHSYYKISAIASTPFPLLPATSLPSLEYDLVSHPPISGVWSPSQITYIPNVVTTYTFTPNPGQCAMISKLNVYMEGNLLNNCEPPYVIHLTNPEELPTREYNNLFIEASNNYSVSNNQNIILKANQIIDLLPNTIYQSSTFFEASIDESQCPPPTRQSNPTVVSVKSLEEIKTLIIFPNPSSNSIEILMKNSSFNKINITSIDGKTVLDKSIKNSGSLEVDVSNYANGLYIVNVIDKDGQFYNQKLIKN
jgi:hypothetical protein